MKKHIQVIKKQKKSILQRGKVDFFLHIIYILYINKFKGKCNESKMGILQNRRTKSK